jgi:4-hydroxybenzoate polyprenyltransferase
MSATPTAEVPPDGAPNAAPQSTQSDPQSGGPWHALRHALADIKLAHSIFALPFAILAAVAARPAGGSWTSFAGQLAIVVACMVLARTWAMMINRIVDREFDAKNVRTARRALAAGRISPTQAWIITLACAAMFVAAASLFWVFFANPWPTLLSIPVLAWIAFYSFTKRFTWLCHVFLGGGAGGFAPGGRDRD